MKGRNPSMSDLGGDANIESDCEPIGPVVMDYAPRKTSIRALFEGVEVKSPSPELSPAYPTPAKSPLTSSLLGSPGLGSASAWPPTPWPEPGPATPSIELATPDPDFEPAPAPINTRNGKKNRKPRNLPVNARLNPLGPVVSVTDSCPVYGIFADRSRSPLKKSLSKSPVPPSLPGKIVLGLGGKTGDYLNHLSRRNLKVLSGNSHEKEARWGLQMNYGVQRKTEMKNKLVLFFSPGPSRRACTVLPILFS